jgi:hypothetical protein
VLREFVLIYVTMVALETWQGNDSTTSAFSSTMTEASTLDPVIPEHTTDLAIELLKRADAAGLKLSTAESCTGGLLASLLTDVEGYGHCFE